MTPSEQLGVLVEPPAPRLLAVLGSAPGSDYQQVAVLDTTLTALRAGLRERLELAGPVLLAGHQAEFVHAGVFAKTIATHVLADQLGGSPVFLTVDADLPRTTQLGVPQTTSAGLRRIDVALPGCDPQRPFEFQPRVPREHWLQFFTRVASLYEFYDRSLLRPFADAWLNTADEALDYGDALARARSATETALGLGGVKELRLSRLCVTPEFRAFVAHLLLNAPRCAEQYNAAQRAYRQRHRVRAPGRPVPPLGAGEAGVELPFWVVRPNEPRRRLYAALRGDVVDLSADAVLIGRLQRSDLERAATHRQAWPLERDGWGLRPRALALTAFARLFLADLFIHGIGGAKYDQAMEDFVQGFFGVEPRPTCCVTATLRLPLPHKGLRRADIALAQQESRDLRYNPQRHLRSLPEDLVRRRAELVRQSEELRAHDSQNHASRRAVFREIRRTSEQMLALDPWRPAEYDQRVQMLEEQWRLDQIALDRECFYALHPRETLAELVQVIRRELEPR